MKQFIPAFLFLILVVSSCLNLSAQIAPRSALTNLHAHNDYYHRRPLIDALNEGFCSVEADIFYKDGAFYVGHSANELKPSRTLESLYLQPLLQRSRENEGKIFPDAETFLLWLDCKTDGNELYDALQELLGKYDELITHFEGTTKHKKAVDVIVSGSSPVQKILNETGKRYMSIDGRAAHFDSDISSDLIPVISEAWSSQFSWSGGPLVATLAFSAEEGVDFDVKTKNDMPEEQRKKLQMQLQKAHDKGRKVRYWGTPDNESFWEFLVNEKVDLINTDRLKRARVFLTEPKK